MESAIKKLPELAYLLESLEYSADTGALTWLERPQSHFKTLQGHTIFNTRFAGTLAGSVLNTGYKAVKLGAYSYQTHRIIWKMAYGKDPANFLDHIDGNRANNKLENLREATRLENNRNSRIRKDNSLGFKGVKKDMRHAKQYVASINIGSGKRKYLGAFATPTEAHAAYTEAAIALHSAFYNSGAGEARGK